MALVTIAGFTIIGGGVGIFYRFYIFDDLNTHCSFS